MHTLKQKVTLYVPSSHEYSYVFREASAFPPIYSISIMQVLQHFTTHVQGSQVVVWGVTPLLLFPFYGHETFEDNFFSLDVPQLCCPAKLFFLFCLVPAVLPGCVSYQG